MSSSRRPCSAVRTAIVAGALAALVVTGCARQVPPPRRPAPSPAPLPVAAALSPASYFQLAASTSLFAVRASELAATRASSAALRSAARDIAEGQRGVAGQLSLAGRRLDLLPAAALPEPMASDLERLTLSADFDSDYRQLVGAALERSLRAHEAFARSGESPTLRPVAAMAAPVTRQGLRAIGR